VNENEICAIKLQSSEPTYTDDDFITPPSIVSGTGYCFRSISFLVYFFVSLPARLYEKTAGPICMKCSWDDLITFFVNSEKPRDAAMRNPGAGFVVLVCMAAMQYGYLPTLYSLQSHFRNELCLIIQLSRRGHARLREFPTGKMGLFEYRGATRGTWGREVS